MVYLGACDKSSAAGIQTADLTPNGFRMELLDGDGAVLESRGIATLIIVTKTDKVSKTRRGGRLQQLAKAMGVPHTNVLGFSALKRDGREAIWSRIEQAL